MAELIIAGKCELQGDAKSLDGHDRDGANCGTNGKVDESILFAMHGGDLVNHEHCECDNGSSIKEESWFEVLLSATIQQSRNTNDSQAVAYRAEEHNPGFGQWSGYLRPAGREGQSPQRQ